MQALTTRGQGFQSCSSRGKYETKKCVCFKSNFKCNSRCHNTTSHVQTNNITFFHNFFLIYGINNYGYAIRLDTFILNI